MGTYFLAHGMRCDSPLFDKTREYVAASGWGQRITWAMGLLLLIAVAVVTGAILPMLLFAVLGVGTGIGLQFGFDGKVARQRDPQVDGIRRSLKNMRLSGVNEKLVRECIFDHAGRSWEELYEELFGYEAKLEMRRASQGRRPRFGGWRDPIITSLSKRLAATKEERDIEQLQKVEAAGLKEQGVAADEAIRRAEQMAEAIVSHAREQAAEIQATMDQTPTVADPAVAAQRKREKIKAMLAEARGSGRRSSGLRTMRKMLDMALGSRIRFIAGALLIAGCLMWVHQNGLFSGESVKQALKEKSLEASGTEPLKLPVVGGLFNSFSPGIAGLLLVVTATSAGWFMSVLAIPAALITMFGPALGVPTIASISARTISAAVGVIIVLVGMMFFRGD